MPTREDVDLARVAIDRGLLTVKESIKCLQIQRDHENNGRQVPLGRVFVEAKFLTEDQLTTLKASLAKSEALRRVGHYEIMSKLGAGGMGVVYKAKDKNADRVVALKVLSPGHAANKEYIRRFLREARASGQLSHPNIVQGYDAGEAGGQYYFAMEFVDGMTVADMLKEGRSIPEQQVLDIAIQIAKALEHAEQNNVVHSDIKPDNIMFTTDGTAKLADLGLARLTTADHIAQDQASFGSAYYASPEQCKGEEELDTKTDMYSFGATLFHMLAGHVPFDDESPEDILAKHLEKKPPYLKDLNVQLSHGISRVVRKLMAKDNRDRYDSMSDLVNDLTLVRMGRSPQLGKRSRYDSRRYRYRSSTGSWRTKKPDNSKKALQISACVGVALGVLLLVVLLFKWVEPGATSTGPDEGAVPERPEAQEPAPRPAHQIFLERVMKKQQGMRRDKFYKELRSVVDKYPGTTSAKRAGEKAANIMKTMEKNAEPVFEDLASEARQLRRQQKYQEALDKLDGFPPRYEVTHFARELTELQGQIKSEADAKFRQIQKQAQELAAAKKYDRAITLYRPVTETFNIPAMTATAATAIRQLRQAKAQHEKTAAEKAEKTRGKQRLAQIQKDEREISKAMKETKQLVSQFSLADAAKTLSTAAGKLSGKQHKPSLNRAAADLEKLQNLLGDTKSVRKALKDKPLTITRKDGTKLEGTVFSVGEQGLSIIKGEAVRSVNWVDLSVSGLRKIAKLNSKAKLGTAEHSAIAALLYFSGRPGDAKVALAHLTENEQQKEAAELRRKDMQFFTKIADQ